MTVSKAYSRLEATGIVRRVRGQGMELLPPASFGSVEERKEQFRAALASALHRGHQLELTREDMNEVITLLTSIAARKSEIFFTTIVATKHLP